MNNLSHKPFAKKTFYLDLKGYPNEAKLAKDIKLFGGRQEQFLIKDVSFVVSNRIRIKPQFSMPATPSRTSSILSPQFFNESSLDCIDSPAYSCGDPNPCIMSRAKAMLQKAREKKLGGSSDILEICKQWNIKVYHVQKVASWIEKFKALYHKHHIAEKKTGLKKDFSASEMVQKIRSPFIKVEDLNKKYCTRFKEFKSWTDIISTSLSLSVSQLHKNLKMNGAVSNSVRPLIKQQELGFKQSIGSLSTNRTASFNKLHASNMSVSNPVSVFGHNRAEKENICHGHVKRKLNDSKKKYKKRFCEVCDTYFTDLDNHIEKKTHVEYMNNEKHFMQVQEIISTLPQIETFLATLSAPTVSCESSMSQTPCDTLLEENPSSATEVCSTEYVSASCSSPSFTTYPYLEPMYTQNILKKLNEKLEPPVLVPYYTFEGQYAVPEKTQNKSPSGEFFGNQGKSMNVDGNGYMVRANSHAGYNFLSEINYLENNETPAFLDDVEEAVDLTISSVKKQAVLARNIKTVTSINGFCPGSKNLGNIIHNTVMQNINFLKDSSVLTEKQLFQTSVLNVDLNVSNIDSYINVENDLLAPVVSSDKSLNFLDYCTDIYQPSLINNQQSLNCDALNNIDPSAVAMVSPPAIVPKRSCEAVLDLSKNSQKSCLRNLINVFESVALSKDCQKETLNSEKGVDVEVSQCSETSFPTPTDGIDSNAFVSNIDLKASNQIQLTGFQSSHNLTTVDCGDERPDEEANKLFDISKPLNNPTNSSPVAAFEAFGTLPKENCTLQKTSETDSCIDLSSIHRNKSVVCRPSNTELLIINEQGLSPIHVENNLVPCSKYDISAYCTELSQVVEIVDMLVEDVVQFNVNGNSLENEGFDKLLSPLKQAQTKVSLNLTDHIHGQAKAVDLSCSSATTTLTNKPGLEKDDHFDIPCMAERNFLVEQERSSESKVGSVCSSISDPPSCPLMGRDRNLIADSKFQQNTADFTASKAFDDFASHLGISPAAATDIWDAGDVYFVLDAVEESQCSEADCCGDTITICPKGASCEESICCTKVDCLEGRSVVVCSGGVSCKVEEIYAKTDCSNDISANKELYSINCSLPDQSHCQAASSNDLSDQHVPKKIDPPVCMNAEMSPGEAKISSNPLNGFFEENSFFKSCLNNNSITSEADFSSSPEREESWAYLHNEVDALCKSIDADDCAIDLSINPDRINAYHLVMQH